MNDQHTPQDPYNDYKARRAAYLVAGYVRNSLNQQERDELDEWITASDDNMQLFVEMTDEETIEKGLAERKGYDADKATAALKKKLKPDTKKPLRFLPYAIAASIILAAGLFFLTPLLQKKKAPVAHTEKPDLQPGGNKAILRLPNGQQLLLDSTQGNILAEGGLKVINLDGKISYEGTSNLTGYHLLSTPKGGQYKVRLPDGTMVWLNAASSLKYPVTFSGVERVVELTGEGYFEVAKDEHKRFKVKLRNGALVEVLGTHFNIMAYEDEAQVNTTLLEGAITLHSSKMSTMMKPGQQSTILDDGTIDTKKDINTAEVIAWKDGLFEFKDEPIESIMRQVARWYDADIQYEAKVNYHFNATIERNVTVSQLFHLLELTDRVHFTIKDKTIIVKP